MMLEPRQQLRSAARVAPQPPPPPPTAVAALAARRQQHAQTFASAYDYQEESDATDDPFDDPALMPDEDAMEATATVNANANAAAVAAATAAAQDPLTTAGASAAAETVGFMHPLHRMTIAEMDTEFRNVAISGLREAGTDFLVARLRTTSVVPEWIHFATYTRLFITLTDEEPVFVVGDEAFGGSEHMCRQLFSSRFVSQPSMDSAGYVHYLNSVDPHAELDLSNCAVLGWFSHSACSDAKFSIGVRCGHQVDAETAQKETIKLSKGKDRCSSLVVAPIHDATGASYASYASEPAKTFVRFDPFIRAPVPPVMFVERDVDAAAAAAVPSAPSASTTSTTTPSRASSSANYARMRGYFATPKQSSSSRHCLDARVDSFSFLVAPETRSEFAETPQLMGSSAVHRLSAVYSSSASSVSPTETAGAKLVHHENFMPSSTPFVAAPHAVKHNGFEFQPYRRTHVMYHVVPGNGSIASVPERWQRTGNAVPDKVEVYAASLTELEQAYEKLQLFLETDTSGLASAAQHPAVASQLKNFPYMLKPDVRTLTHKEEQVLIAQEYHVPRAHPVLSFLRLQPRDAAHVVVVPFMDFQQAASRMRLKAREEELMKLSRSMSQLCVQAQPVDPRNAHRKWQLSLCLGVLWAPLSHNGPDPWAQAASTPTSAVPTTYQRLLGATFTGEQITTLLYDDIPDA